MIEKQITEASLRKVQAYLQSKEFLAVDPKGTNYKALSGVLQFLQIPTSRLTGVRTYHEASEVMRTIQPHIVLCEYYLQDGHLGTELLELQREYYPSVLESVFILSSGQNREIADCAAAEEYVDYFVPKPYTVEGLRDLIARACLRRIDASQYDKMVEEGRLALRNGDYDEALGWVERAKKVRAVASEAWYVEGLIQIRLQKKSDAIEVFKKTLDIDHAHYGAMLGLFDLLMEAREYAEAYDIKKLMTQIHPVSVRRVPELVKLCILTGHFEDLDRYFKVYSELDHRDPRLTKSLTAGLMVAGKHLMRVGDAEHAAQAFRQAEVVSESNPSILKEIVVAYLDADQFAEAKSVADRCSKEIVLSDEVRIAETKLFYRKKEYSIALRESLNLIRDRVYNPDVFEVAIASSLALRRRRGVIEELIQNAVHHHPDQRKQFEKYIPALKGN